MDQWLLFAPGDKWHALACVHIMCVCLIQKTAWQFSSCLVGITPDRSYLPPKQSRHCLESTKAALASVIKEYNSHGMVDCIILQTVPQTYRRIGVG